MVSINDGIVDTNGGVAAGHPLHPAGLGAGPWWVHTSVLSVRDPKVRVVGLDLDALDDLDRIRDVGVVDERAVPDGKAISIRDQRSKWGVLLFFQEVDEFNVTKLPKVPLQSLLTGGFEVLDVSNVHVPRHTGVDGECEDGRK